LCRRGPQTKLRGFEGDHLPEDHRKLTRPARSQAAIPYWLAILFLIFAAVSWAGSSVAGRAASGSMPPFSLSFIRWFFVFLCFALIGGRETWAQRRLIMQHLPIMMAFALFGVVGFTVPYYVGLQFTVAVNASLMNASGTLWIVMTAFLMTGDLITRKQSFGIALGFTGTVIIVLHGNISVLSDFSINIGDMLVLVAYFAWAVYTVMLRWKPRAIGEMAFLTAMTGIAVLMMAPLYAIDLWHGRTFEANFDNIGILTYAVIFPSFLAYIVWNKAVPVVGASVAGMTQYLIPIIGVILSVILLGESIETYHMAGMAVIFTGVWLVTSGKRPPAADAAQEPAQETSNQNDTKPRNL
jgi:drug/metabolite transporter (DMT)-like permease